jgi:hypothetical protein
VSHGTIIIIVDSKPTYLPAAFTTLENHDSDQRPKTKSRPSDAERHRSWQHWRATQPCTERKSSVEKAADPHERRGPRFEQP